MGYKLIGVRAETLKPTNPKAANQHLYLSPSLRNRDGVSAAEVVVTTKEETVKPGAT